jgi:hypothetical protein
LDAQLRWPTLTSCFLSLLSHCAILTPITALWFGDNATGGLSGRFGGVKTYFVAQFGAVGSRFTSYGVWDLASSQLSPSSASINGTHVGAWIGFDSTHRLLCTLLPPPKSVALTCVTRNKVEPSQRWWRCTSA